MRVTDAMYLGISYFEIAKGGALKVTEIII